MLGTLLIRETQLRLFVEEEEEERHDFPNHTALAPP